VLKQIALNALSAQVVLTVLLGFAQLYCSTAERCCSLLYSITLVLIYIDIDMLTHLLALPEMSEGRNEALYACHAGSSFSVAYHCGTRCRKVQGGIVGPM